MQRVLEHKDVPLITQLEQVKLGVAVANHLDAALTPRKGERTEHRLWFSQLGTKCFRKTWYEIKHPELAEPLSADNRFKYLYGNVIEELALNVAIAAGHKVERQQERIEVPIGSFGDDLWSLTGRIDAVIDGHVIDVKSMSTYSFKEQPANLLEASDMFGYTSQLRGYNDMIGDPARDAALLCVDKQLGHMKLSVLVGDKANPAKTVAHARYLLTGSVYSLTPPSRRALEPMGKSGNMKLDTYCSYCPFKRDCWSAMRTFLYAGKPVHLVEVVKEPDVPELKYDGEEARWTV